MSRRLFGVLCTFALASAAMVALPGPAGAADTPFGRLVIDIEKQVVGDAPAGDFHVEIDCDSDGEFEISDEEIDLNGDGDSEDVEVVWFGDYEISCTVEETDDLGASSVSYECDADEPNFECADNESEDPAEISFDFDDFEGCIESVCVEGDADVTITNTFEPPTTTTVAPTTVPAAPRPAAAPAVAAVAAARFTG